MGASGHVLIPGASRSGKTTLAKKYLAPRYKAAGVPILVLDPMGDPDWNADFQTDDPDEFLRVLWDSEGCACFVDEAGESAGTYDKGMHKTATKGRHWGHRMHYLMQRPTMVSPNIRTNCDELFAFILNSNDIKALAEDFAKFEHRLKADLRNLERGEYVYCTRFGEYQKGRVF